MKYLHLIAFIILCAITVNSQSLPESSLRVSFLYKYNTTDPHSGKSNAHNDDFLLLASPQYSYFYGVTTHYLDSVYSDPKSRSEYLALRKSLIKSFPKSSYDSEGRPLHVPGDAELGLPTRGSQIQVIKDLVHDSLTVYDAFGNKKYRYKLPIQDIDWIIQDSVRNISGFDCILATTTYCGRKWAVWFCQDIPVCDGPWQLRGLPGLILMAESDDKDHVFIATAVQTSKQTIAPPPIPMDWGPVDIDRNKLLQMQYNFILNPYRSLKERGFPVLNAIGPDNEVKHDFLETDYR